MKVTDEMVDTAFEVFSSKTIWNKNAMRAALEAALETAIKQPVRIQDPRVLAEILIVLGPSSNGAVERDLRHALEQQAACIEDLTAALIHIATMDVYTRDGEKPAHEIMRDISRATLERWGLR